MDSNLISALIGSFVGGFFTLWGIRIQYKKQKCSSDDALRQLKVNLLKGIKTEIGLVVGIYKFRSEPFITNHKKGTPLDFQLKITQDNFTFYNNNANKLAELNSITLSEILNFYIYAKSLIDTYNTNNEILDKITEVVFLLGGEPTNKVYKDIIIEYTKIAIKYSEEIKGSHFLALQKSDLALKAIDCELDELAEL